MALQYQDIVNSENGTSANPQTGEVMTAPTTQAISLDSLAPATPIDLSGTNPPPDNSAAIAMAAGADGTSKSLQDYIKELTPTPTDTQNNADSLTSQISSLLGQDTGKAAATSAAESAAGVPDLTKQLKDLNNQITTDSAGFDALVANLELNHPGNGKADITASMLAGQQGAVIRAKAADIGVLTARAQAAQGNLTLAKETASKAVDLKYSPIEEQLKVKQDQLALLLPTLKSEEATQAKALDRQYEEQKQKIADDKAEAKTNIATALSLGVATQFVNQNGKFFDARTGHTFGSAQEFFKAAGVSSFEEAYHKGLVTDATASRISDVNTVQNLINKYGDAGILSTDSLAQAVAKLQNSAIYKHDTYIAPTDTGFTLGPGQVRYDAQGNVIAGSDTTTNNGYVKGADPIVDSYIANFNSGKIKNWGDIPKEYQAAVSQGVASTNGNASSDILATTKQSLKELQDMVDHNRGFTGAVGYRGLIGTFTGPIAGTSAADFAAKAKQVVNDIVLPNLTLLHGLGRVTDREFQALQSAVTSLSVDKEKGTSNLSETQFKTELKTITDRINQVSTQTPTTDVSTLKSQLQPGEILVQDKQGNYGAIKQSEFDPNQYTEVKGMSQKASPLQPISDNNKYTPLMKLNLQHGETLPGDFRIKIGAGAAVKNNNPGNLRNTDGSWQKFATAKEGFQALTGYLNRAISGSSSIYKPTQTLYQFFAKYAPAADSNNPKAYAEAVAKKLGVSPNTQIKQLDIIAWAKQIAAHESNTKFT